MASYTQRVLAESLKKLLNTKPMDTITVKDVVDDSGMNRKTFYYHFHGIPDLLKWTLSTDMCTALNSNCKVDTWRIGFASVMHYIKENETMMQNICDSSYWPQIRMYLGSLSDRSMKVFVEDALQIFIQSHDKDVQISDANIKYVIMSYSILKCSLMEEWFLNGMKESVDEFLFMFERLINVFNVFQALAVQTNRTEYGFN